MCHKGGLVHRVFTKNFASDAKTRLHSTKALSRLVLCCYGSNSFVGQGNNSMGVDHLTVILVKLTAGVFSVSCESHKDST